MRKEGGKEGREVEGKEDRRGGWGKTRTTRTRTTKTVLSVLSDQKKKKVFITQTDTLGNDQFLVSHAVCAPSFLAVPENGSRTQPGRAQKRGRRGVGGVGAVYDSMEVGIRAIVQMSRTDAREGRMGPDLAEGGPRRAQQAVLQ